MKLDYTKGQWACLCYEAVNPRHMEQCVGCGATRPDESEIRAQLAAAITERDEARRALLAFQVGDEDGMEFALYCHIKVERDEARARVAELKEALKQCELKTPRFHNKASGIWSCDACDGMSSEITDKTGDAIDHRCDCPVMIARNALGVGR